MTALDRDLLVIGFTLSRIGFVQLACVVRELMQSDRTSMTEVYNAAASACGTTAARVARNVHLMIDAVYIDGNARLLDSICYGKPRPPDKEFLHLLAHYLQTRVRVA